MLVFLVAHEAFHYLRKTKQVEGRHGEIEADAFALKMLEQYRDGSNTPYHRHTVVDGIVAGLRGRPEGQRVWALSRLLAHVARPATSSRPSDYLGPALQLCVFPRRLHQMWCTSPDTPPRGPLRQTRL